MKKNLFYLIILFCSVSLFSACSDDDDPKVADDSITGVYKGTLDINATLTEGTEIKDQLPQKIYIDKTGDNKLKLQLKNFQFSGFSVGDIVVSDIDVKNDGGVHAFSSQTKSELSNLGTCDLDINGTIEGEKTNITIGVNVVEGLVKGTKVEVKFNGTKLAVDQSSTALITEFTFSSEYVTTQPLIDGKNIIFYVADTIPVEALAALAPEIKISDKATISPKSGEKQDFSKAVTYTVTSEDGVTTAVYTVSVGGKGRKYGFEEWVVANEGQTPENTFYEVAGGWSSSNTGAFLLKAMQMTDRVVVTQNDDAYSGKSAARIETLDTKGADYGFVKVPKVTTGTLFLGEFETEMTNTLASTKFGVPFSTKPSVLKGYYKYAPGEVYYKSSKDEANEFTVVEGQKDECAINAILYEVSTFDDPNYEEYLTGVNAYTSDKLVAVAQLQDGTAKAEYTSFELEFQYIKAYDPAKKYRLAIICSSSKDGDSFSGAPGSVLFVDDFELISE